MLFKKTAINIFPNPVSDNLTITTEFPAHKVQQTSLIKFELYDLYGVKVMSLKSHVANSVNQLAVSNLIDCVYILKIIKNSNYPNDENCKKSRRKLLFNC